MVTLSSGWEKIADACKIRQGGWIVARFCKDDVFHIRVFNPDMVEVNYLDAAYVFKSPTYLLEELADRLRNPRVIHTGQPSSCQWSFEKVLTEFQKNRFLVSFHLIYFLEMFSP